MNELHWISELGTSPLRLRPLVYLFLSIIHQWFSLSLSFSDYVLLTLFFCSFIHKMKKNKLIM